MILKKNKHLLITTQMVDENSRFGFFIDWIKNFSKYYKKVSVICLQKGKYTLPDNVKVFSLGKENKNSRTSQILKFYKLIIKIKSDTTFIHMNPIWAILGYIIWKIKKTKINLWYAHVSKPFHLKIATKLVDKIITSTKESFIIKTNKINVVGQGINTDLFNSDFKEFDKIVKIVSASRISESKDFITAFKVLKNVHFDFNFDIYGEPITIEDKNYFNKLQNYLKENKLEEKIRFKGLVKHDDLPYLYGKYNIFLNQSKTDSLDKAVLEAMSCRMMVLTSNNSFKKWLPKEFVFKHEDLNAMTTKLNNLIKMKNKDEIVEKLRNTVVKYHSIKNLARNVSEIV